MRIITTLQHLHMHIITTLQHLHMRIITTLQHTAAHCGTCTCVSLPHCSTCLLRDARCSFIADRASLTQVTPATRHVQHVTCHMSRATRHVPHVTCHMSRATRSSHAASGASFILQPCMVKKCPCVCSAARTPSMLARNSCPASSHIT